VRYPNDGITGAPGLFRSGKSKHLYDFLYLKTRGAIVPVRKIRMTKSQLMRDAGIGSRNTFDSIIADLRMKGLVQVSVVIGEQAGNEFEVFTPEEIGYGGAVELPTAQPGQTGQTTHTSNTSVAQNQRELDSAESGQRAHSPESTNNGQSADGKTLFKDFLKPDDEPLAVEIFKKLNTACRATTGRDLRRADLEGLDGTIDMLIQEVLAAGERTKGISVFGKFMEAVVRRKLCAVTNEPTEKQTNGKASKKPPLEFFADSADYFSESQLDDFAKTYIGIRNTSMSPPPDLSETDLQPWAAITEILNAKLNKDVYRTWFGPIVFEGIKGNELTLRAGRVTADWVGLYYTEVLQDAARETGHADIEIKWNVAESMQSVEEFERQFAPAVWQKILERVDKQSEAL
jgi:hypothetical protein